jgi:hypothetical protein
MSGQVEVSESASNQCVVSENPGIDAARQECLVRPTAQKRTVSELPDAPSATLFSSSGASTAEVSSPGATGEEAAPTREVAGAHGHAVNEKFLERHQLWLTTGFFSKHFTANNNFNQKNTGAGAELQLTTHNTLTAGWYYNSIRQNSFYAADELRWQIKDYPIKVGVGIGIVSGYRTRSPIIPMGLPMVSLEANKAKHPLLSHLGADLVVIPPIGNKETGTPTVAAVRVKFGWGNK